MAASGVLDLVAVANTIPLAEVPRAPLLGTRESLTAEDAAALAALDAARAESPDGAAIEAATLSGDPVSLLLSRARERGATLVGLGSHGTRRPAGVFIGSIATTLLHELGCSVLIARARASARPFPASIVAGVDTSVSSWRGAEIARALGERFDAPVRLFLASGGRDDREIERLRAEHPELVVVGDYAVGTLVAASRGADLLVVGSRGVSGLRALGSVSERVAHRAHCSVLVVR